MPGDTVVLREIPRGFMGDLPAEEQKAISEITGKPLQFNGYDDDGRVELEFDDSDGVTHFIYVSPEVITIA